MFSLCFSYCTASVYLICVSFRAGIYVSWIHSGSDLIQEWTILRRLRYQAISSDHALQIQVRLILLHRATAPRQAPKGSSKTGERMTDESGWRGTE